IDSWCQTLAFASCERDVRCKNVQVAKLADCMARLELSCDQAAYSSAVKSGRLQYFPNQGARCLDAYGSGSCIDSPAACDALFLGLVPPDGGCILPDECQPSGYCYLYDQKCPHACRPFQQLDAGCTPYSDDTRCDPSTGFCNSGPNHCEARKGIGESCNYQQDECRDGLACSC